MIISQESNNGFEIFRLAGRLDAAAVRDERDRLMAMASNPGKGLLINMSQVELLDSSGLGFIVTLYKRNTEKNSIFAG